MAGRATARHNDVQRKRAGIATPGGHLVASQETVALSWANTYRQFVQLLGPSTEASNLDPLNAG
jgi:hypothetical protein